MSLKQASNIVNMLDYTTEEKSNVTCFFILLEYCPNGSLKDYISKISSENKVVSEGQIWKIALQISIGLKNIHDIKYAHRDLKSENILVTLQGQFKITDFSSSTNRYYETISNHNRNEIIFDISKNTSQSFRAPEQVDLYSGYPINEKVDIWALGIIIYTLIFDNKPFYEFTSGEFNQVRKGNLFTDEMINNCNPLLIELLKMLLKINPKERASASEVISFIEKNVNNLNNSENNFNKSNLAESLINLSKKNFTFSKKVSDATAKLFKRHSTQFWILKLTNDALDYPPKFKFIKNIVMKAWQKRPKVVKVYINISSRPLHFISSVALKSVYVLHHYLFLGPQETLYPKDFYMEDFLLFFINLWNARLTNENYDKDDKLKNANITKFIVSYAEFIKAKISFHKKYPFIDNNYSLDGIIKSNQDITLLVDKKFINDLITLYSMTSQKLNHIPVSVKTITKTIDLIIQIFNEELFSIFSLLFYLIVAYKKFNSNSKNENIIKAYDSHFFEISNKIQENLEKLQKYRNDIKSSNQLINFNINSSQEYLKNLDNHLKFFPIGEFNLRIFLTNDLEAPGINLNTSIGRLVDANIFDRDYITSGKKLHQTNINQNQSEKTFPNLAPSSHKMNQMKEKDNKFFNNKNMDFIVDNFNYSSKEGNNIININKSRSNSNCQRNNNKFTVNLKNPKLEDNIEINNNNKNSSSHRKANTSVSKLDEKPFEFTEEKFLNSKKNFDFDSALNNKNSDAVNEFESIFSNKNNKIGKPPIVMNNSNNKNMMNNKIITHQVHNNIIQMKNTFNNIINISNTQSPILGLGHPKDEISKIDSNPFNFIDPKVNNNIINIQNINSNENLKKDSLHNKRKPSFTNLPLGNENDNFNNMNNKNNQSLFNHNFFSKSQNPQESAGNNITNDTFVSAISKPPQIPGQRMDDMNKNMTQNSNNDKNIDMNVINVLNEIFDSNKSDMNNQNMFSNYNVDSCMFSNGNFQMVNNLNNFNIPPNKNLSNRPSINNINNISINQPNQIINNIQPMNNNPVNMNNNQTYFNFYQNQTQNNTNMFFPPNQQTIISSQLGNYPQNSNLLHFNKNNQILMTNTNMDNTLYDTDKVKKTLYEMDKVYNNSSNNYNNQNISTNANNFNPNINNINIPSTNYNQSLNNSKIQNLPSQLANPINNRNLYNQQNINNPNIYDQNEKGRRSFSNTKRNTQEGNISPVSFNDINSKNVINNNFNNINQNFNINNKNQTKLNNDFVKTKDIEFNNNKNNQNIPENRNKSNINNFKNKNINPIIDEVNRKNILPDSNDNEVDDLEDFDEMKSNMKSDVSNINIFNIETHINNISLYKEEPTNEIEKIANDFLCKQFSKGNLHWLISSKDIETEKQIGFGGSSEVYKGNYRGTEVAIKKLRIIEVKDENLKEFKREVSSLVMLRHPNLVLFMGAIAEKDNICIVTEYCAGGTLFNILHQKKELIITWELRLRILYEIAVGMNFLHTNNPPIIHRDLKSLNILLTEKIERPTDNTKIKISDFGLSRIIRQFDSGKQQMTGQLGTCHWMAPEVIENKNYTLKADVFSYGIIIWEICSRKTPYGDMTQQQISYYVTVKKGRPDKSLIPHNVPPAIIKLMESCWDADPNNRPTFSQILEYLKKIKL